MEPLFVHPVRRVDARNICPLHREIFLGPSEILAKKNPLTTKNAFRVRKKRGQCIAKRFFCESERFIYIEKIAIVSKSEVESGAAVVLNSRDRASK